jgi:ATP adenylyltransferase
MDYLWSPWRYQYVTGGAQRTEAIPNATPEEACLFCRVASRANDREDYIVLRAERNFVMLNRFPYTTGHLLIAPYEHVSMLEEARTETLEELIRLAQRCEAALRKIYQAGGFNLGFNIGQAAGAGIAGHIHMHVMPRWHGDTSFVTTIGETRVLPEALETTYERVVKSLSKK